MSASRLVFFGTDAFSVPSLVRLLAEDWPIVAVVTKPDSRTGRGRELTQPAAKRLAWAKDIAVLQPTRVSDIADHLADLKPTAGVVVAYGKIIPSRVLELFPQGLINVHASLLPKYRGASPIEAALLNGDTATGVTLMQLDAGMDTGPTYDSNTLQLTGHETREDLYEQLAEMGADLLATKLAAILDGTIVPVPQDDSKATSVSLIAKSDGQIDWNKSAIEIERQVRAYLGWPGSVGEIAGAVVTVTASHVIPVTGTPGHAYKTSTGELAVHCRDQSLVIDRLKPAGKREMSGPAFLAGHQLPTG